MEIKLLVFSEEHFNFSKLHENVAEQDKRNFKRDFTMTFEVKT